MAYNPSHIDVSSWRGAPMGRRDTAPIEGKTDVLHLVRVKFYDYDYDKGGAYWGGSSPLYVAWAESEDYLVDGAEVYVRAGNRDEAKTKILAMYPFVRFLR